MFRSRWMSSSTDDLLNHDSLLFAGDSREDLREDELLSQGATDQYRLLQDSLDVYSVHGYDDNHMVDGENDVDVLPPGEFAPAIEPALVYVENTSQSNEMIPAGSDDVQTSVPSAQSAATLSKATFDMFVDFINGVPSSSINRQNLASILHAHPRLMNFCLGQEGALSDGSSWQPASLDLRAKIFLRLIQVRALGVCSMIWQTSQDLIRHFKALPQQELSKTVISVLASSAGHNITRFARKFIDDMDNFDAVQDARFDLCRRSVAKPNSIYYKVRIDLLSVILERMRNQKIENFRQAVLNDSSDTFISHWAREAVVRAWFNGDGVVYGLTTSRSVLLTQIELFDRMLERHAGNILREIWSSNIKFRKYYCGLSVEVGESNSSERMSLSADSVRERVLFLKSQGYDYILSSMRMLNPQISNMTSSNHLLSASTFLNGHHTDEMSENEAINMDLGESTPSVMCR